MNYDKMGRKVVENYEQKKSAFTHIISLLKDIQDNIRKPDPLQKLTELQQASLKDAELPVLLDRRSVIYIEADVKRILSSVVYLLGEMAPNPEDPSKLESVTTLSEFRAWADDILTRRNVLDDLLGDLNEPKRINP